MQTMQISENVTVGPQPSEEELQQLPQQGFQSVINFRTSGEDEQPLSPEQEGERVRSSGMSYLHIPVSMDAMETETVNQFRRQFRELPKPAYAHCKSGKRAGAMVMMHMASESGMSGEETVKKADEMGFECDKPELIDFVKSYVDTHAKLQ